MTQPTRPRAPSPTLSMGFGLVALLLPGCLAKMTDWKYAGQGFEPTHEESVYIGHSLSAGGAITDSTGAIRVPLEATAMCQDAVWGQQVRIERRLRNEAQILAFNGVAAAMIGGGALAVYGTTEQDVGKIVTGIGVVVVGIPIPAIMFGKGGMARAEPTLVRRVPYEQASSWRTGPAKACATDGLAPTLAPQPALSVALPPAAVAVGGTMPITWGSATSVTLAADGVRAMRGWTQECAQSSAATIRVDLQGLAAGVNTGATPPRVDDLRALRAVPAASRTGGAMVKLTFGEPTSGDLKGVQPLSNAARACVAAAPGRCADGDRLACVQAARTTADPTDAQTFADMARLIDEERCVGGGSAQVAPDPAACDRAAKASTAVTERAYFSDRAASLRATKAAAEERLAAATRAEAAAVEAEARRQERASQLAWEAEQRRAAQEAELRRQASVNALMSGIQSAADEASAVIRANDEKLRQLQAEARAQQAADEAARQRAAEKQQADQRAQVAAQRAQQEEQARRTQQAEETRRAQQEAAARATQTPAGAPAQRPAGATAATGDSAAQAGRTGAVAPPPTATPAISPLEAQRARAKEAVARAAVTTRSMPDEDADHGCGGPADNRRAPLPSCLQEVARSKGPCGNDDGLEVKVVNRCDRRIYAQVCFLGSDNVRHCGVRGLRPGETWNRWTCVSQTPTWTHDADFASNPRTESFCTREWSR
jgi:hypothetical protein